MIRKSTIILLFSLIQMISYQKIKEEPIYMPDNIIAEASTLTEFSDDMNRLKKLWFIEHNLIKCFSENHIIWKEYKKMLKRYLGMRHHSEYANKDIYNSDWFDIKLTKELEIFEKLDNISPLITYMFDETVDYIYSFRKDIFHKIDKKKIANMAVLGYIASSVLPTKNSIAFNMFIEHGGNATIWNSIVSSLKMIFSEIGFANEGAAYNWFDVNLATNLMKNKTYNMFISGGNSAFEYLSGSEKILREKFDSAVKTYSKKDTRPLSLNPLSINLNEWMSNKINIGESIPSLLNTDNLFALVVIGNIGLEEKVNHLNFDHITKAILLNCSSICRFVVDEICKECSCKTVKWGTMPFGEIREELVEGILRSIAYFGNLDGVLKHLFAEKYSKDTEALMSMMTKEIESIK
jgi:hypothetical protein